MKKLVCLLVVLAMASSASAVIVAAYEFDGNFDDSSGFGTPAPATQGGSSINVNYDDAGVVSDSERGNVLSLANGASLKIGPRNNSHGNVGHAEKLDFVNNGSGGNYTMGAWVKTSTMSSSVSYVVALGQASGARLGLLSEDGQTAGIRGVWTTLNPSGGIAHTQKTQQVADFEWNHLAVT